MPNPDNSDPRRERVHELTKRANLVDVAQWLGLQVVAKNTRTPLTLCPFHDDQKPSLHFFPAAAGGQAHYHCFACGAHGDVFDLIKKVLGTDFPGALAWLAQRAGVTLPAWRPSNRRDRVEPRAQGLDLAFRL